MKMSIQSRRELLRVTAPRYQRADRVSKRRILDEFVAATGYQRKYAIHLLHNLPSPSSAPSARPKLKGNRRSTLHTPQAHQALVTIWKAANHICGKRLVPALPQFIEALERHGELCLDAHTRWVLLRISPATADRWLKQQRQKLGVARRGLATTKPGTLLKHQIPVRTFADWGEAHQQPGFIEADLVAHCGQSTHGEYLHTLTLTDICTGWTECLALLNRSQHAVSEAIREARSLLPFPLLGLDSDNGSEFINANLKRYCEQEEITFTRCRPYKKNDQAHVEQKNWNIVRQIVGYDRYEGAVALSKLQALYCVVRLYTNFFQPVMKLQSKQRVGSKVHKQYDRAATPYQRILNSDRVADQVKQQLAGHYLSLNPAALLRQIEVLQHDLWRLALGELLGYPQVQVRITNEATITSR